MMGNAHAQATNDLEKSHTKNGVAIFHYYSIKAHVNQVFA